MTYQVASFFSGAGGLDLGFRLSGFDVVYANENSKHIWGTYEHNHPDTHLDKRSITEVERSDIPDVHGIIGGPPCQSWSAGGSKRGASDPRGKLFFEFITILKHKQPAFFLAENVAGMLMKRHEGALANIVSLFDEAGYRLHYRQMNVADYGFAQDRKRVIFVGFRKDLGVAYSFPEPTGRAEVLRDVIGDLDGLAVPAINGKDPNPNATIPNHEYATGGFSPMYMSRNRVRSWDEPSFTIQASGRQSPIHPSAPKMTKVAKDEFRFSDKFPHRRMTVRESARIQGFPDDFLFKYEDVNNGYRMVGNAVHVGFSAILATSIYRALQDADVLNS